MLCASRNLATIQGHTFFTHCLSPGAVVLDLGANRGEFSRQLLARSPVRSYAVEASPAHFATIPVIPGLQKLNFAIAAADEIVELHVSDWAEGSGIHGVSIGGCVEKVRVQGRRLETLLAEQGIGRVDLLKVDIEGAELDLFGSTSDATLATIAQVTLEFHDLQGLIRPQDVDAIVGRLLGLGFVAVRFSQNNGNWHFFRPDRCRVSAAEIMLIRHVYRNVRGLYRRARSLRRRWTA